MTKRVITSSFLGIIITAVYLSLNLLLNNHYGVTWDYTYHLNAGNWHLGKPITDKTFIMGPSPPLSDVFPALMEDLFSDKYKLLEFDSAYNLYSVIIGSLGIGVLYYFTRELFDRKVALFSCLILALLPRYFGHLHNNMKDIPQSVYFTLSLFLFWKLTNNSSWRNLLLASVSFAIAINSKVNALLILPIAATYIVYIFLRQKLKKSQLNYPFKKILSYFLITPISSLILWSLFWKNPIKSLLEAVNTYTSSTTNMPILYFGNIFRSGDNVPWHYPLGIIFVTTPFLIILLFLLGLILLMIWKRYSPDKRMFLLLWFFIPLSRYLKPHMVVIDDVRHFMEVIPPFAVIAGIGLTGLMGYLAKILVKFKFVIGNLTYLSAAIFILIIYLAIPLIRYHPFQTSYYSEIIGGIKGAQEMFDIEFWASSYKYALGYLNTNAAANAKIIVAMAPDIAKLYLREDLKTNLNERNISEYARYVDTNIYYTSDYSVILNRQSMFYGYRITKFLTDKSESYFGDNKPVYTLTLQSVPLVYIYKN